MKIAAPSLRILYLEDNPVDADLLCRESARLAPELGLEVVATVGDAMERLAPESPPYDVVLTDLNLSDGSGLDLLAHIRERNLPLAVVIITGAGDQQDAVAALKAGADDYLVKRNGYIGRLPLILSAANERCKSTRKNRSRQLRVLYAEQNASDADLTRRYLSRYAPHISLEVVASGEEVLAREQSHDVLLLDYRLPGLNALEVVKVLRQERGLEIPIMLVTGHGSEEVAVQALRLGVNEYLVKTEGYLQQLPSLLDKMQKHAELTVSEERYRSLFEHNRAVMLVVDPATMDIVDANPAAAAWYGWSREELCSKNISEINTLPLEEVRKEIDQAASRRNWHFLFRHRRADGSIRDVEIFSGPVKVANRLLLHSIIHDITEKKRAEEELKKNEKDFRQLSNVFQSLLDAIPDSIILRDAELNVLWDNKAAVKSHSVAPDGKTGQRCYALKGNQVIPCSPCPVLQTFKTGLAGSETLPFADGRIWDVRTVPLRDEDGAVEKVIEIKRDITEHRKLESRYLHAQKMESIGTLAGGVAHDFNNILTAILGYGQILQMNLEKDSPNRRNVEQILIAADRATQLTKELLLFSRKQEPERRPVELNEIVGKMVKFLHRIIGEDIAFKWSPQVNTLSLLADRYQLEQVLMNLAVNARDAMPDGGEFTLQTELFQLREDFIAAHGFGTPGEYALLTVSDTGVGMNSETLQHIFEPFFTTKEVGKGTGLGLAVVYGIIEQHDGFINVYSEPGMGSTFRIYLPLTTTVSEQELPASREQALPRGTETILLAEDEEMVRVMVSQMLTEAGYTVIEAVDGEDAVQKFRDHADSIQLLLFDLIMPKRNGKEAFEAIHKIQPGIKAIFASGYTADLVRQKASLNHTSQIIYKPISPLDLLKTVRMMLDKETISQTEEL